MGVHGRVTASGTVPVRLALSVAVFSLAVVVVGGIVRVTGSGLGCPDWPLCHGQVVPPVGGAALIEFSHRLVAGLFAAGVYLLALRCRRRFGEAPWGGLAGQARAALTRITLLSALLVTAQAVLGGLNVLTELAPGVGGAHLILAMVVVGLLASAAVLAQAAAGRWQEGVAGGPGSPGGLGVAWTAVTLSVLVVGLGAYVRALGASLACTDWPLCGGGVLPPSGWPFWLQWGHRVAALGLGVAILAGAVRSRGRGGWLAAALLYAVQVGLGAVAVWWQLPPAVRVLHLGVAALLVAALSAETTRTWLATRQTGLRLHERLLRGQIRPGGMPA